MRSLFKWTLILSLACVLLAGLGGAALLHALTQIPDVSISINGEAMDLAELGFAPISATLLGMTAAALVVCVVLPLVLLLGVGLPLLLTGLMLGLVLALLLGLGALLGSPIIVLALLLWLLLRPRRAPRAAAMART
jgi:hypothetical protein